MRPGRLILLSAVAVAGGLGACRAGAVRIAYQPKPGAKAVYRVTVHAVAVTTIGDQPARRTVDDESFTATHDVLAAGRVRVKLTAPGLPPRTFVVRIDRGAQLAEVQTIEGVPASALGGLGLAEIFPAAAAAPPDRALAPGDRWTLDEPVALGGPGPVRLTGIGRLIELGVVHGRKVATIFSQYRVPILTTSAEGGAPVTLDGSQSTVSTATRDLADGVIETVHAHTDGRFRLSLSAPPGGSGPAVPGLVTVEVRSTTRRLR